MTSRDRVSAAISGLSVLARTQRDDQPAPALAHFSRQDEQFFFRGFLLRVGRGLAKERKRSAKEVEKSPAPVGSLLFDFSRQAPGTPPLYLERLQPLLQ